MRTRVKICGITRPQDGVLAARTGVDAIGLVFYPYSPRYIGMIRAREICYALPPFITKVALFVNAQHKDIITIINQVPINLLQFHGNELPDHCMKYNLPWIKGINMKEDINLHKERERFAGAQALLIDSYQPNIPGGTGKTFSWKMIPRDLSGEIILAGGLNPNNVVTAIKEIHPWAVDVSSSVERKKGVKDSTKIKRFMQGVTIGDKTI